jgi:alanine racemase
MDVVGACGGRDELVLHAANSAAVIDMPQTHLDMVRPGLAIYGYQSSEEMHSRPELRPALRLVARVMQIKDVPSGASCGYGLTYAFDRPSRLALVPVGYADGYLRYFSNRATMYVAGGYAPVRGRVSMDQTILDVTDIPTAAVGDEVEIISRDPSQPHSVENLAQLARTIPYEITCLLGERVRRILVE